jgi:hypothetical protein
MVRDGSGPLAFAFRSVSALGAYQQLLQLSLHPNLSIPLLAKAWPALLMNGHAGS